MSIVAVITQPLRAAYCDAYLQGIDPSEVIHILTSDPAAFNRFELGDWVEVHSVTPAAAVVPTRRLMTSKLHHRLSAWARSGSPLGMRLLAWSRRVLWRLRYLDRLTIVFHAKRAERPGRDLRDSPVVGALVDLHEVAPVSRVVVFDLFDLPAAMAFGDTHHVPVLVR